MGISSETCGRFSAGSAPSLRYGVLREDPRRAYLGTFGRLASMQFRIAWLKHRIMGRKSPIAWLQDRIARLRSQCAGM